MIAPRRLGFLAIALGMVATLSGPVAAQSAIGWDPRTSAMTRDELQQVVDRLDEAAASPGYSAALRSQARDQANFIRARLENGDYQVGDRVVLRVIGASRFTDTLSVQPGRVLVLPDIGEIPLEGVLRSELQQYLEEELSRYLQDPVVRATSLIRLAVLGEVNSQGFYAIPSEALVGEAIMIAGGPGGNADLDKMEIRRGKRLIWGGEALQQAVIDGRTLDQLNLRAGDRILVPEKERGFFTFGVLQGILTALPTAVFLLSRLF